MKKEIPTQKIELSKHVVELYDFLTTGEVRKVQREMFQSGVSLKEGEEAKEEETMKKAGMLFNIQDVVIGFLFVGATKIGSEEREIIENPLEWVGNLSPADGNLIYNKITEIMNASMMNDDAKKN